MLLYSQSMFESSHKGRPTKKLVVVAFTMRDAPLPCSGLTRLPDDMIQYILTFCCAASRIALITALCKIHNSTAVATTRLRLSSSLASTLLIETAATNLSSSIRVMADTVLWKNRVSCVASLVVVDWSVFARVDPDCCACIHWSTRAPHANVECYDQAILCVVRKTISMGRSVVRLSSHNVVHGTPREHSKHHITILPVHSRTTNVFEGGDFRVSTLEALRASARPTLYTSCIS